MANMSHQPDHADEKVMSAQMDDIEGPKKTNVEMNVNDDEVYTLSEQRQIIHKVDRRLLTVLGLMQAVSFLDRANMSNAAIAG
jgi:hypothetical protein